MTEFELFIVGFGFGVLIGILFYRSSMTTAKSRERDRIHNEEHYANLLRHNKELDELSKKYDGLKSR